MPKDFLYQTTQPDELYEFIERDIDLYGTEHWKQLDEIEFEMRYGISKRDFQQNYSVDSSYYTREKLHSALPGKPFTKVGLENMAEGLHNETIKYLTSPSITSGSLTENAKQAGAKDFKTSVKPSDIRKNSKGKAEPKITKQNTNTPGREKNSTKKDFELFKKNLFWETRGTLGRKMVNLKAKALKTAITEAGVGWDSEEAVDLIRKFFPESNIQFSPDTEGNTAQQESAPPPKPKTQSKQEDKSEGIAEGTDKSAHAKQDEAAKENEGFMQDELSVATDKHNVKATKDAEGKNVLEPEEDKSQDEGKAEEKKKKAKDKGGKETGESKQENQEDPGKGEEKEAQEKVKPQAQEEQALTGADSPAPQVPEEKVPAPQAPTYTHAQETAQLNQAPPSEAIQQEQEQTGSKEEIAAKAQTLKANFNAQVELEKSKIQQQASQQRAIIQANYDTETNKVIAETDAKKNELTTKVQSAKHLLEAGYQEQFSSLKAMLDADIEKVNLVKAEKLETISTEVNTRKENFAAYIAQQEAAPINFAKSEQTRIKTELTNAAEQCIQQSQGVAAKYSDENQKKAAMEVGNESAKDILDKITPMQENVMELAEDLQGNYSSYKEKIDEELSNLEAKLKPQIESSAEATTEQLKQSHEGTVESLNSAKEKDLNGLDQLEQQNLSNLDSLKENALNGLKSNYQQGIDGLDSLEKSLIEGITSYANDINQSIRGEGDPYLPGIEATLSQAGNAISNMGSTANNALQGQSTSTNEGLSNTSKAFVTNLQTSFDSAAQGVDKLVEVSESAMEKIVAAHTEQAEKSIEDLETQCKETIDNGFKAIDDGIVQIKEKIEEENKEAHQQLKEKTDENIDKAKAPLYDDNRSRSDQAAQEAGISSWWDVAVGVLQAIATIALVFLVVVLVAALLVAFGVFATLGAALWAIGAILFVVFLVVFAVKRWKQRDKLGFWGFIGVVIADTIGITDIYESITNKDIVEKTNLGLSDRERGNRCTMGIFTLVMTFIGVRAKVKGIRTSVKTNGGVMNTLRGIPGKLKGLGSKALSGLGGMWGRATSLPGKIGGLFRSMRSFKSFAAYVGPSFARFGTRFMGAMEEAVAMVKAMGRGIKDLFGGKNKGNNGAGVLDDADNIRNADDAENVRNLDDAENVKPKTEEPETIKDEPETIKEEGEIKPSDIEESGEFSPKDNIVKKGKRDFVQTEDIKPAKLPAGKKVDMNTKEIRFMQDSISNHTGDYWVLENAYILNNGGELPASNIKVWCNLADDAKGFWTVDHRRLAAYKLSGRTQIKVEYINVQELMASNTFKMTSVNKGTSIDLILYFDEAGKFINPQKIPKGSNIRPRREIWHLIEQSDGSLKILNGDGANIDISDIIKYLPND